MNFSLLTVGNPNSGKTSLFNGLTGARQQVGNWSGVTVEKKTGHCKVGEHQLQITDLPGVYSLSGDNVDSGKDEQLATIVVESMPADVILNIVDASALERSLYLTLQLLETGRPVIVVINKTDALERNRQQINVPLLSQMLGCPVFAISAHNHQQVMQFRRELVDMLANGVAPTKLQLDYGEAVENTLQLLVPYCPQNEQASSRSLALRLLEHDRLVEGRLSAENQTLVAQHLRHLEQAVDTDLQIADVRYSFIHHLCQKTRKHVGMVSHKTSERIDKVVLNRYLGLPIFLLVMYLMFVFSIKIGSSFIDFFDISVGALLVDGTHHLLDGVLPVWLVTLLADGFGAGIQTVATFIPVIGCLYLFMAILEGSGYMARAAFVLDKLMQKIGLPGRSFVPLVIGFGCNVPAIMATRTLTQERERLLTVMMTPFMSCGARLPVYALFATAFFPSSAQNVVFALYLIGILVAVFTGLLLRKTLLPGISESFVMDMPDYEWPTLRNIGLKTWQKLKNFVFGAGKTIVLVVAALGFFNSLGTDGSFGNQNTENSVLAQVAKDVTPVLAPIGIEKDNWPATVGIITGIFAKEAVVGTLNALYSGEPADAGDEYNFFASFKEALLTIPENLLSINLADPLDISVGDTSDRSAAAEAQEVNTSTFDKLSQNFAGPAAAFSYLLFVLLYTPCVAAMGAFVREVGRNWALFVAGWTMLLAYVVGTWFYQIMHFSQHPAQSAMWLAITGGIFLITIAVMRVKGSRQQSQQVKLA
ncbi:MAG: Fe(2+) transporter permease subunit FeoB [Plesiomonas shigelloides]|uniref:Ferrous iron transport protein B n=1 Tax=Plesiomonas shigelloides 302-73 TaxID=1315976 RepID=R8ANE0_PLESH|nr:Fe(2+) transporter permease subunit FeoB [Plesiomonas shigelloides]EON87857.1 ferrous iron transport protein B [Plesiomonas shigelloides 302-73]KAB7675288.1 Fe(2+) transporter permease subunit FeoB [Plesiomonas shigelloides]KAB7685567.1 Fe(2+) transporter permease subunit FeoB [Plesiomonas shigelloides]KAB7702459.1 Fe(2+) transporter permease subunit FeoB [Plesiomonas shigelloides]